MCKGSWSVHSGIIFQVIKIFDFVFVCMYDRSFIIFVIFFVVCVNVRMFLICLFVFLIPHAVLCLPQSTTILFYHCTVTGPKMIHFTVHSDLINSFHNNNNGASFMCMW